MRKGHIKECVDEGDIINKELVEYKISGDGDFTSWDLANAEIRAKVAIRADEALTNANVRLIDLSNE